MFAPEQYAALVEESKDGALQETYRSLNERFYQAEPADYFRTRLFGLVVLAGRPEEMRDLLADGVSYANVTLTLGSNQDVDRPSLERHVAIESQVLLHHAAEALVRLFFAHVGLPPCPWSELAGERDARKFKQRVETEVIARRHSRELVDEAAWVFLGRTHCPTGTDAGEWAAATEHLTQFLVSLAGRWLNDAPVYNSLKHGLSVRAANASFVLSDDQTQDARTFAYDMSVEFLETKRLTDDKRLWQATTQWLDVSESLSFVDIVCRMVDSLWMVGKHRYLGLGTGARLFFPLQLQPSDLRSGQAHVRFSTHLFEEVR